LEYFFCCTSRSICSRSLRSIDIATFAVLTSHLLVLQYIIPLILINI
jgi:hypothetical protein